MILGISQPTFMPYAGYFGLLDYADCFVFLDNVQFDKRSWQQRNYIFMDKKAYLLTVPVLSKGKFHQKIDRVKILNDKSKEEVLLKMMFPSWGIDLLLLRGEGPHLEYVKLLLERRLVAHL